VQQLFNRLVGGIPDQSVGVKIRGLAIIPFEMTKFSDTIFGFFEVSIENFIGIDIFFEVF